MSHIYEIPYSNVTYIKAINSIVKYIFLLEIGLI